MVGQAADGFHALLDRVGLGGIVGWCLVAYCRAGWRFSDPYVASNRIPGFRSGGSPAVVKGSVSSEAARTVDVAPTVGSIYGLKAPAGSYDGTARDSALTIVLN